MEKIEFELPNKLSYKYLPLYWNDDFNSPFYNKIKFFGFYGGRASGKSFAIADYIILSAVKRYENIMTVREFNTSITDSSFSLYKNRIEALGLKNYFQIGSRSIKCKTTGSTFSFKGLERNPDNIRSYDNATLTVIEEAQYINDYSFEVLIPTILRNERSRLICIWNPQSPDNPVDRFFFKSGLDKIYTAKLIYKENPFFPKESLGNVVEMDYKRNYLKYMHVWEGEYFTVSDAIILNNISIEKDFSIDGLTPCYGIDFGSTDPNAFIKAYVDEENKYIYITEAYKKQSLLTDFADYVKTIVSENEEVICDSAWMQSIEILKKYGIRALPAKKGPNSILTGLNWLQDFKIVVHPRAYMFADEAKFYTWKVNRKKINEDGSPMILQEPIDEHNHLIDALRYATELYRKKKNELGFFVLKGTSYV